MTDTKHSKLCLDIRDQIRQLAPEVEDDIMYDMVVLTLAGWLRISISSSLGDIAFHSRFEEPHLADFLKLSDDNGKWNHYFPAHIAQDRISKLLLPLWPSAAELPYAQFLGAVGRLVAMRRSWLICRAFFGPPRKRLRVLDQPIGYPEQAACEFWSCASEFGVDHAGTTICAQAALRQRPQS